MDEELDLQPYVAAILRNWMWIIGAMILAGLLALGATYLISATYRATALVAVTEPRQVVQFDPRIRTTEDNQPIRAYPELAASDELLSTLLEEVKPIAPHIRSLSALRGLVSAEPGSDPSLVKLSAETEDPELSSEIANKWAVIFVDKANEVFGTQGTGQLEFFEDQLVGISQDLQQAEQDLIVFQARNRLSILDNRLVALQQAQADQLTKQRQIIVLLQDLESLQEQLTSNRGGGGDSVADQLAAILLQLRAFSGISSPETTNSWHLQIDIAQLAAADRQDQIDFLAELQNTLSTQMQQIDSYLEELEPEILAVQQDKQEVSAEESRLNRNLNVVEETYTALARKVEEDKITSQNTNSGVRLASRSAVPESPSGPRKLIVVAGAAFVGASLVTVVIVLLTWWRRNSATAPD